MKRLGPARLLLGLLLLVGVGLLSLLAGAVISLSCRVDGASCPPSGAEAPMAFTAMRDRKGRTVQLFESRLSHLSEILFTVPARAGCFRYMPGSVAFCKLYELRDKPRYITLSLRPERLNLIPAGPIVARRFWHRGVLEQLKLLGKRVLGRPQSSLVWCVGQTFVATGEGLSGIRVLFGTYGRPMSGTIVFHLKSEDSPERDIVTQKVEAAKLQDGEFFTFRFKAIKGSRFKLFYFYITSPDCEPRSAPTVFLTDSEIAPNGNVWASNIKLGYDVVFEAKYTDDRGVSEFLAGHGRTFILPHLSVERLIPIRQGPAVQAKNRNGPYLASFKFRPVVDSSARYYIFTVQINGTTAPCARFLCRHDFGILPEAAYFVANRLMIDKPAFVTRGLVVSLGSAVFFLLFVAVVAVAAYAKKDRGSSESLPRPSADRQGRRAG